MNIVILGGAGFIGQKLAIKLAENGVLRGKAIEKITLCDMVAPQNQIQAEFPIDFIKFDMTDEQSVFTSIPNDTDVIFHLASIVSGQAEADMELGYKVNLDGMFDELSQLDHNKLSYKDRMFVSDRAHLVTKYQLQQDIEHEKKFFIGTSSLSSSSHKDTGSSSPLRITEDVYRSIRDTGLDSVTDVTSRYESRYV